jgi:ABC-type Fe3+-siderophore transport system permease subunit
MVLFFLLIIIIIISIIAISSKETSWPPEILKLLGQAVTGVIGAVVGASAASGGRTRRK